MKEGSVTNFESAAGSADYLKNGGDINIAKRIAGHSKCGTYKDHHRRVCGPGGDGSYETFSIGRIWYDPITIEKTLHDPRPGDFCKTNFRPYDLCVQCCLIVLQHHLPRHIRVGSDGSTAEWMEAIDGVIQLLGYGQDFEFDSYVKDDPNHPDNKKGRDDKSVLSDLG